MVKKLLIIKLEFMVLGVVLKLQMDYSLIDLLQEVEFELVRQSLVKQAHWVSLILIRQEYFVQLLQALGLARQANLIFSLKEP